MNDIKEKLDKIQAVLGDEAENLVSYTSEQLLGRAEMQKSIEQDIGDVLSTNAELIEPNKDIRQRDIIHRLSSFFCVYDAICEKIIKKEVSTKYIGLLEDTRKKIIKEITTFHEINNYWLNTMKEQFLPIIEKLEATIIDKDDANFLATLKSQKEIQKAICQINKNQANPNSIQYRDWRHRLGGKMEVYFVNCSFLAHCIEKEREFDEDMIYALETINRVKPELIAILKSLNDMTVNLKEKMGMEDIISYIRTKFTHGEVDTDDSAYILCSNRVFQAIIDELRENYRKYGTDGYSSIKTKDNMLVISLKNKKKEKDENDFSSGTGSKIFAEYMKELGGIYTSDYSTDDCITTIRLPIYFPKQAE